MANPALLLLPGNGVLTGTDRAGSVSAVATGALRYQSGKLDASQAFWVEEATTNLVSNPWCAVDTTGWTATAAAITRVTTYAYQGPGAGNLAATGLNAMATISITATAVAHTAQWIVRNRHTVARSVQLKYNALNIGTAVSVAADATAIITAPFTGTGAAANLEAVVTDSANTENMVIYYAGAEAKTYATSPCPAIDTAGTIVTGYTWAGTANASTSTRAATTVKADETNRISPLRGAFAAWVWRDVNLVSVTQYIFSVGDWGVAGKDWMAFRIANTTCFFRYRSGVTAETSVAQTTSVVGTWVHVYGEWDSTAYAVSVNNATLTTGVRAAPQGDFSTTDDMAFGTYNESVSGFVNGRIGPVMMFDRPLTAAERTRLYARTEPWTFGMLDNIGGLLRVGAPGGGLLRVGAPSSGTTIE